ncbi:transporter [Planctomicrobium piriforme]|uniref:Putative MetA-pathway of phenol degradation n=1 Tax=Planctomicrobium piriforme TaxID=1576369 RepID=A0A1I3D1E4_9PLAN|nr:transporter [Planctomicrobium piriforme]SFH80594.1 Putative MetA-pathway of phenol degradation [Planctomicrobium piriforme]
MDSLLDGWLLLRRLLGVSVAVLCLICPARGQAAEELFIDRPIDWLLPADSPNEANDEEEPLETDRDSFTPATTVVGRSRFLFETSYSFIDNRSTANSHSFPESLLRYGITDRIELRLGWNYEIGGGGSVSGTDAPGDDETVPGTIDEANILYGLKASLTEQNLWIPQSAVIVQATTPTAGPETPTQLVAGYVCGWKFANDWTLDSAIRYGAASEEGDSFNQWAPSIVLKVPVHEHWNIHAEYFGIFTDNSAKNQSAQYFSPGIHYLISSNIEIGCRVGWGLTNDSANFFSNVGLGVRF